MPHTHEAGDDHDAHTAEVHPYTDSQLIQLLDALRAVGYRVNLWRSPTALQEFHRQYVLIAPSIPARSIGDLNTIAGEVSLLAEDIGLPRLQSGQHVSYENHELDGIFFPRGGIRISMEASSHLAQGFGFREAEILSAPGTSLVGEAYFLVLPHGEMIDGILDREEDHFIIHKPYTELGTFDRGRR